MQRHRRLRRWRRTRPCLELSRRGPRGARVPVCCVDLLHTESRRCITFSEHHMHVDRALLLSLAMYCGPVGYAKKIVLSVKALSCTEGSSCGPRRNCFQQHLVKEAHISVALEASRRCVRSLPIQLWLACAFTGTFLCHQTFHLKPGNSSLLSINLPAFRFFGLDPAICKNLNLF